MKNKYVAAALAFFLGAFGIHKFYLGRPVQGFLHLIFFWTFLSSIIALIESVMYLAMPNSQFNARYNGDESYSILNKERTELERERIRLERLRLKKESLRAEQDLRNQIASSKEKIAIKNITGAQADELEAWQDLLKQGIIDEFEYEEKRKAILGINR